MMAGIRGWKVMDLRKWLADHGQKVSGVKEDLIERVENCKKDKVESKEERKKREHEEREQRLKQKLRTPRQQLPNPKTLTNWDRNLENLPNVIMKDLINYLVLGDCEHFSQEQMNCHRQLKAYTFFKDGHVQDIEIENVTDECEYQFVRAKVIPSMRTDVVYTTWAVLAKATGFIHSADCNCSAGLGEACNHIAALLFAVEDFCRTQKNAVSCTSLPCKWNQPRKRKLSPRRIVQITPVKHVYGKEKKRMALPDDVAYKPSAPIDASFLGSFLNSLTQVNPNAAILTVYNPAEPMLQSEHDISGELNVSNFQEVETETDNDNIVRSYNPSPLHSGIHTGITPMESNRYFDSIKIDQGEADLIEECSRGQNKNPKWKIARIGRLTASMMGAVYKKRETTAPDKLVSQILQDQPETCLDGVPAIRWGREHEQEARQRYITFMKVNGHRNITVFERGLVVNVNYPYLGASPDGYVYCPSCKEYQGLLEIKCPYKWRDKTINDALKDSDFYCYRDDKGEIRLKQNSNYFIQVQGQMAVCRRKWCDFIVWTNQDLYVQRITFNEKLWEEKILPKLKKFYMEAVVPRVIGI